MKSHMNSLSKESMYVMYSGKTKPNNKTENKQTQKTKQTNKTHMHAHTHTNNTKQIKTKPIQANCSERPNIN